jgi:hypothetical protein
MALFVSPRNRKLRASSSVLARCMDKFLMWKCPFSSSRMLTRGRSSSRFVSCDGSRRSYPCSRYSHSCRDDHAAAGVHTVVYLQVRCVSLVLHITSRSNLLKYHRDGARDNPAIRVLLRPACDCEGFAGTSLSVEGKCVEQFVAIVPGRTRR